MHLESAIPEIKMIQCNIMLAQQPIKEAQSKISWSFNNSFLEHCITKYPLLGKKMKERIKKIVGLAMWALPVNNDSTREVGRSAQ